MSSIHLIFVALLVACATHRAAAASSAEISALTDFYSDLKGENWKSSTNWLSGDPCTQNWVGVSCSGGSVTSLILNFNNLNGVIPDSINELVHLQTLELSNNFVSGTLTPFIGQLSNLVKLDLSHNYIAGPIPSTLSTLVDSRQLYELNLSYNKFTGSVPSYFNGAQNNFKNPPELQDNRFHCPIPSWADYTGATCVETSIKRLAATGNRFGSAVMITTEGIAREDEVYCIYPDLANAPTMNAAFVTQNVFLCPTPVVHVSDKTVCGSTFQTSITLHVGSDPVNGQLQVVLLPTNCEAGFDVVSPGRMEANKIAADSFCLNGICVEGWDGATGGDTPDGVSFHKCASNARPSGVPHSVPAGQWWYHTFTESECNGGLPPADKNCVAGLNTIIDCAVNAYYGDWRIVMPGETHNGVHGPAIYWWCYEGCSTRSFYRAVHFICTN